MIDDPEKLAQDLRTLADRLEDGEVEVQQIEFADCHYKEERCGEFGIEFIHEEVAERWRRRFNEQVGESEV